MKAQHYLYLKARELRAEGKSYSEIANALSVSKSTLSYWLKDFPLTEEHREKLYTKQISILSRGPKSQQTKRAILVNQLVLRSSTDLGLIIDAKALKFLGIGLYWAEGNKGKSLQFTNSDPFMIFFIVKWLELEFKVKASSLKFYLNIYAQQNESEIKVFWSDLLKIPLENFGKTFIKPASQGFKRNNLYYGTIKIYVPKSTDMKYQIDGWLHAITQNYQTDVKLTQDRWSRLRETKRAINLNDLPR